MIGGQKPKVSVIMGVYNCENTIAESIESILNQTYKNWELIICDDASTDGTYAVARRYADHYADKIKLIKNEKNQRLVSFVKPLSPIRRREIYRAPGRR